MSRFSFFNFKSHQAPSLTSTPKQTAKDVGFLEVFAGHNPIVDIVAIHGLDGHREDSWTADNGTMWLRDLLPIDIPNARILTYGYDADTRSFGHTSTQTVLRHAREFAECLWQQRKPHPERPIIFLAHSLGGIILKRALGHCNSRNINSARNLRDITTSTIAVLFFGTPHSGANGVGAAELMHQLLSVYMSTNNKILRHLRRESGMLEDVQDHYFPVSQRVETIFLYEEYETPIFGGVRKMIVPHESAVIMGDSRAREAVLHADHCQIVKFAGEDDPNYRKVADFLTEFMGEGPERVRENWIQENGTRNYAAGNSLATSRVVLLKPLLPVSRNYVERPHMHAFLTEKLLPSTTPKHQPRCILHGLGGGGKTQLASAWIEAHQSKFNRIIVIDASNQQKIEADLETAIRSIGPEYSKSTWRDAVAYLSSQKGWLILFDNADSPDLDLEDYLPNSTHGAIIVTTRNRDCISYAADSHIAVGRLAEEEAVDLLHKVANVSPPSSESSLAIVKELGMWALAITQAGAYIFNTRRLDTYLATFRQHRDRLMRKASLRGINYKGSTYTAFELSFGQLTTEAQELMKICAFLHHSSIPFSLFKRSTTSGFLAHTAEELCPPPSTDEAAISHLKAIFGSTWDEYSFQRLIESISRGSLMEISTDMAGQSLYHLHPLVQAYIRDRVELADEDIHVCSARQLLLGAIRPLEGDEINSWYHQLSFHIESLPPRIKMAHASHAMVFLMVYNSVGNWDAGKEVGEYCYSQPREVLGPQHLATISVTNTLIYTVYRYGQTQAAEKMAREVLELQPEVLRPENPERLIAMQHLVHILQDRGDLEEAEKLEWETVALGKTHGLKHHIIATTMANLTFTICGRGRLVEAEKLGRESLAWASEVFGPLHPTTLHIIQNLALTLSSCGKLKEAELMGRETLRLHKEAQGARHPNVALALGKLASILDECGQQDEAEKMHRQYLVLQNEILGSRHPWTVDARSNVAWALHNRGQLEEAEKMQQELLVLQTEILGPRHQATAVAMRDLALMLCERGQLKEAEDMQREVLVLQSEDLGVRHQETLRTMADLASTLYLDGQLEEAGKMQREVLVLQIEILGAPHPDVACTMRSLARTLITSGLLEEAEKVQREALALQTENYGVKHPTRVATLGDLAWTLHLRGQLEEVEALQQEILGLQTEIHGAQHHETVITMVDLAATFRERGRFEEAAKVQREVLELRTEILGAQHQDTITAMAHLAVTLGDCSRLDEVETLQREVLRLRTEILGAQHRDTIMTMINLSLTLCECDHLKEAEKLQREVLALQSGILGARHEDKILTMTHLVLTLIKSSQLEEAERIQREVLALQTEVLGARHEDTVLTMTALALILSTIGQLDEAVRMQRQVIQLRKDILGPEHPDTIEAKHDLFTTFLQLTRQEKENE